MKAGDYAKYSGMAVQMAIVILLGVYAGRALDRYFGFEKPALTVVLALLSIFAALYLVLRDFFKKKDE